MDITTYHEQVELARDNFIRSCRGLTAEQAHFTPNEESWSIVGEAEHIVQP
ncbi:MAG: hypothetical protein ACKO6Q_04405 [Bacteroidota bacterium]